MRDNVFEEFGLDPSDPDSIDELIDICNPTVPWDDDQLQSALSDIEKEFGISFYVKKQTKKLDINDFVSDEITITVSNCYLNDRIYTAEGDMVYKGSKRFKKLQEEIDMEDYSDDIY